MSYLDPLPEGVSLQVFNENQLIFESKGKWLQPLFELEDFLKTYSGPKDDLRSHDSAIGKAAAILTLRCGVKRINAELLSELGKDYIESVNAACDAGAKSVDSAAVSWVSGQPVVLTWKNLVPKLLCATENQLENYSDSDEMYYLVRTRAKLVQGVSVKAEKLCHHFGKINDLCFEVAAGGRLMITGENGAGKSTLLKLLCGILKPDSGRILIDEKPLEALPKYTIGYIPQFSDTKGFSLSVEEVCSLGVKEKSKKTDNDSLSGIMKAAATVEGVNETAHSAGFGSSKKQRIKEMLERTGCAHLAKRSFNSLSGGEKQKVQLARCLLQDAKLLLLDEPTASLDKENKRMVLDILRSLSVSEIPTIIIVTHDKELEELSGWKKLKLEQSENTSGSEEAVQ